VIKGKVFIALKTCSANWFDAKNYIVASLRQVSTILVTYTEWTQNAQKNYRVKIYSQAHFACIVHKSEWPISVKSNLIQQLYTRGPLYISSDPDKRCRIVNIASGS